MGRAARAVVIAAAALFGAIGSAPIAGATDPPPPIIEVRGSLGRISVEATTEAGTPIDDVSVVVTDDEDVEAASGATDAFGGLLVDVEPGATYEVEVTIADWSGTEDWSTTRSVNVLEEDLRSNPSTGDNPRVAPSPTYGPDPAVDGYEAADAAYEAAHPRCEEGTSKLFCQQLEIWKAVGTTGGGRTSIEVRDGTKLDAFVQLPAGEGPFPVVLEYSLYEDAIGQGGSDYQEGTAGGRHLDRWLDLGYAVVGVQVRGLGCSGGWWDLNDPVQFSDGFDVVEVLARQAWSTGVVGMTGISGPGMMATFTASTTPPSLGAIAVGGVAGDLEAGFPGGMFNDYVGGFGAWMRDRAQHFSAQAGSGATFPWIYQRATGTTVEGGPTPDPDDPCAENHRLRGRDQVHADLLSADALDDTEAFDQLDVFIPTERAARIDVPTLLLGGWQDAGEHGSMLSMLGGWQGAPLLGNPPVEPETEGGRLPPGMAMAIMTNGSHMERDNPMSLMATAELFALFVAGEVPSSSTITTEERDALASGFDCATGPCRVDFHGMDAVEMPPVHDYGSTLTAARAAWLARASASPITVVWESGAGRTPLNALDATPADPALPSENADGGLPYGNFTSSYSHWPPTQVGTGSALELGPDGALSSSAATETATSETYRYDPLGHEFPTSLVPLNSAQEDVRPTPWKWLPLATGEGRTGVSFQTEPLAAPDFHVGRGYADLWVRPTLSTPGDFDYDVEVNVIEVRPDGSETLVEAGRVRASKSRLASESFGLWPQLDYASAITDPVDIESGSWMHLRVAIQPYAHVFRAGSRIMVEVTSPGGSQPTWSSLDTQQGQVPEGADLDLEVGTGGEHASSFVLPVLPDADQPVADSDARLQRQVRCGALRAQPCRSTPHQMETPDVEPAVGAIEASWRSPQSWMGVNARVAPTDEDGFGDGSSLGVTIKEREPYSYEDSPAYVFTAPGSAVPAAPGRQYTASLKAKAAPGSSLTGATVGSISFFDRDGVYVATGSMAETTMTEPDEDGWVTGTSTANVPPDAVLMVVGASFEGDVGDRFFVDDASIVDAWDWTSTEQLTESQRSPGAVSAVDQVDAIEVRVSPVGQLDNPSAHLVSEVAADATTTRVEGLDDDTEYQVQVRAKGPGGWGTPSPWSVPVTPRTNLLGATASIVETEPWGWGGYGTTISRTTSLPRSGAGALRITVDNPEGAFLQSSMGERGRVPVTPGEDYSMRACFRGTTDARTIGVGLNFYEEDNYWPLDTAGAAVVETTTGWTCTTATGTAPLGAEFAVIGAQVPDAATGEVHLGDDFGIWLGTEPGDPEDNLLWAPAANIEGGWTPTDATITSEWSEPGDPWTQRLTATAAAPEATTWDADVLTGPPWSPSPDLRASVLVRSLGAPAGASLMIELRDDEGTIVDTVTTEATVGATWSRLSVRAALDSEVVSASLRIVFPDAVEGDSFLMARAELVADTTSL